MTTADRRRFIKSTAALAGVTLLCPRVFAGASRPRRSISLSSMPGGRTVYEQFHVAADLGFSGVEMRTAASREQAERVRDAASQAGLRISSVVASDSSVSNVVQSLNCARLWSADAVSVPPATCDGPTSYRDAWQRSQHSIKEQVLPMARDLGIVLTVEKIWNGFLIGPSELARYVDAFESPWIRAGVDTSRAVFYTQPEDWVRVLGPRIANVRIGSTDGDYRRMSGLLDDMGYTGWLTFESDSTLPRFKTA